MSVGPDLQPFEQPHRGIKTQRLVFGRMYEDAAIESQVLPPGRVLCIASAGDTALALAADGRQVVAVDLNHAQINYVRSRLDGAPTRPGSVERLLAGARTVLGHTAWRRADLPGFCALTDLTEQQRRWRRDFDTRTFRAVLGSVLSPLSVRAAGFAAFTSGVGTRFDSLMRERLHLGLGRHRNAGNPYLQALLLGRLGSTAGVPAADAIDLLRVDVAGYLESAPAGSFDGFSLSNVLDGADAAYCERLRAAVRRAAAPGAVAVWRTFRPATSDADREWAARDRSLFWGGLRVESARGAG